MTKGRPAGDDAKLPGQTAEGSKMLRSSVAVSLASLGEECLGLNFILSYYHILVSVLGPRS